jgi:hypothetical protein
MMNQNVAIRLDSFFNSFWGRSGSKFRPGDRLFCETFCDFLSHAKKIVG